MCRASKILTTVLIFGLFTGIISRLYAAIAFPECITNNTTKLTPAILVVNITAICTDSLIFGIIVCNVFGIWKLKRQTGIQSDRDLVSVLLSQSASRFCFVIILGVANAIVLAVIPTRTHVSSAVFLVIQGFVCFQDTLSPILVANFTLDLRQLNSANIEASNLSLPSLRFSNVLQHVHQSIVVELANPEERITGDLQRDGDHEENILRTSDDIMDIQPAQN